MQHTNLYVGLPYGGQLYIYQTQGLLVCPDGARLKISLHISHILQLCLDGLVLYDAIEKVVTDLALTDEERTMALLGISQLCIQERLVASQKPISEHGTIVDESGIYYPEGIHLELTKCCNFRCYYCYREASPTANDTHMDGDTIVRLVKQMAERGLKLVEITGGEPLMHPEFEKIATACIQELSLVSILTNGFFVDERLTELLLPFRDKVVFSVSFDSWRDDDLDRRSAVKGAAPRIKNAIRLLSDKGFLVRASMAVDERNWPDLEATLLAARELGARKFAYTPIMPLGRAPKEQTLWTSVSQKEAYDKEVYLIERYKDFLDLTSENNTKRIYDPGGCGAGHTNFVLAPDGNVRLCASYDETIGVIGNVLRQPLEEVFGNPLCALSAQLRSPSPVICGDCERAAFCSGCALRGTLGAEYVGKENCRWLKQGDAAAWYDALLKSKV